ncbi:MAG: family 10 glycosylhydrolase, partial [Verrucomicrobiae bacterium]|nr:family 10 glycosylhydrolase [Verrucomicrobiae bacterium]
MAGRFVCSSEPDLSKARRDQPAVSPSAPARRFASRFFAAALLYLLGFFALRAQEFRAAWADVFHVGMGSTNEINTMVSNLVVGRYNAVIVQVLAYHDADGTASHGAHWKSSIVPWSTRVKANFDPLAYLCQRAHAYGIEVHAWLGGSGGGMYRVSTAWPPAGNSTLANNPQWFMVPLANSEGNAVVPINGQYMLDMGSADAQEYLISIVRELVTNYEIDGIHWDDEHGSAEYSAGLGYPAYSASTYTNSGLARYRRNTGATGTPSNTDTAWSNYRRRFKNELIARTQAEIQAIKSNPRQPLRHTSATMAYGGPPSTCTFTSEEAYTYFSDWPTMLQNGWLDAAVPMNYKAETNNGSLFRSWCDRAYACWRYDRHIFMGLGAYMNTRSNNVVQLRYVFDTGFNGAATYSYAVPFATAFDSGNWWTYVATNLYTNVVSTPPMPWRNPATATNGIMWGRVRNASTGEYVDDATVTVAGRPAVKSDGNGYYVVTLIPASGTGTLHTVTASKTGFASQTLSNVVVLPGD